MLDQISVIVGCDVEVKRDALAWRSLGPDCAFSFASPRHMEFISRHQPDSQLPDWYCPLLLSLFATLQPLHSPSMAPWVLRVAGQASIVFACAVWIHTFAGSPPGRHRLALAALPLLLLTTAGPTFFFDAPREGVTVAIAGFLSKTRRWLVSSQPPCHRWRMRCRPGTCLGRISLRLPPRPASFECSHLAGHF